MAGNPKFQQASRTLTEPAEAILKFVLDLTTQSIAVFYIGYVNQASRVISNGMTSAKRKIPKMASPTKWDCSLRCANRFYFPTSPNSARRIQAPVSNDTLPGTDSPT
jgi:hypothetical protein